MVFDVAPHADEADPQAAAAAQRRAALCVELEAVVRAMGLQRAWETKPLVDGKSVMAVLGMKQVCALPSPSALSPRTLTSHLYYMAVSSSNMETSCT